MKQKTEIRPKQRKNGYHLPAWANGKTFEQLAFDGKFELLVLSVGLCEIGKRKGLWTGSHSMVMLLRSLGLRYDYSSYYRFLRGEHLQFPSMFLLMLMDVTRAGVIEASAVGRPLALSLASAYPERWGEAYQRSIVEASQLAA